MRGKDAAQVPLDVADEVGALPAKEGEARGDGLPRFRVQLLEARLEDRGLDVAISARRATPSLARMCSTCAPTVRGDR